MGVTPSFKTCEEQENSRLDVPGRRSGLSRGPDRTADPAEAHAEAGTRPEQQSLRSYASPIFM